MGSSSRKAYRLLRQLARSRHMHGGHGHGYGYGRGHGYGHGHGRGHGYGYGYGGRRAGKWSRAFALVAELLRVLRR